MDNVKNEAPATLEVALQAIIPNAKLTRQQLPDSVIWLWLIQPDWPSYTLHDEALSKIWTDTPYWVFCWASGLAMARYILAHPHIVQGKTVCDFGAGSGVVAIAAALAGAQHVIACDIDQVSLQACRANAALNGVSLQLLDNIYTLPEHIDHADVLFAADVLYDQSNRFFLDEFLQWANEVWVADSRVKNFTHPRYFTHSQHSASTWPDLDEANEFRNVFFYKTHTENSN